MTAADSPPPDPELATDPDRSHPALDTMPVSYGFPRPLWRMLENSPAAGAFADPVAQPAAGPWLTSVFGAVLLVVLPIVIITGLLSYIAYGPKFGHGDPRRRRLAQAPILRLAESAHRGCTA